MEQTISYLTIKIHGCCKSREFKSGVEDPEGEGTKSKVSEKVEAIQYDLPYTSFLLSILVVIEGRVSKGSK